MEQLSFHRLYQKDHIHLFPKSQNDFYQMKYLHLISLKAANHFDFAYIVDDFGNSFPVHNRNRRLPDEF
jgi:hypothetical protein